MALRRIAILLACLYSCALLLAVAGSDVVFSQQQVINGLSAGAIYGALALALVLTLRSTGVINIALGETSTLSAFVAWSLIVSARMPYWLGFLVVVAGAGAVSGVIERLVVHPLLRRGVLPMIVATAGVFQIVRNLDRLIWRDAAKPFPTPFGGPVIHIDGVFLARPQLGTLLVISLAVGALAWLLQATRFGLGLRAAVLNAEAAFLCGVRVDRMLMVGWALSSALGAVAGILVANFVLLDPPMLEGALIYALAAAVLGGFDRPAGALTGGILVGIIDSMLGSTELFKALRLPTVAVIVLILLVVWPHGILGSRESRNV